MDGESGQDGYTQWMIVDRWPTMMHESTLAPWRWRSAAWNLTVIEASSCPGVSGTSDWLVRPMIRARYSSRPSLAQS